jgi:hypothetical protein
MNNNIKIGIVHCSFSEKKKVIKILEDSIKVGTDGKINLILEVYCPFEHQKILTEHDEKRGKKHDGYTYPVWYSVDKVLELIKDNFDFIGISDAIERKIMNCGNFDLCKNKLFVFEKIGYEGENEYLLDFAYKLESFFKEKKIGFNIDSFMNFYENKVRELS